MIAKLSIFSATLWSRRVSIRVICILIRHREHATIDRA
jgi:hypothetical protein